MPAEKGTLRIRYEGRTTVFEYKGITKAEAPEVLGKHLDLWSREMVGDESADVPRSIVRAFWVTKKDGAESEEALDLPPVPKLPSMM